MLAIFGLTTGAADAAGQIRVEMEPVHRFGGAPVEWAGVTDVDATDSLLVVSARSEPYLYLYQLSDGTILKSWGARGEGPGEFGEPPTSVALVGPLVYAVDLNQQRLNAFDTRSDAVETRRGTELGLADPAYVARLERVGNVLLVMPFEPMGRGVAVVAWRGQAGSADTLVAYERPARSIGLDGPPRFGVPPPFTIGPLWTATTQGIAYYPDEVVTDLRIVALDGSVVSRRNLSLVDRFEATAADREWWMDQHIPQEFAGRRGVFDAVRNQARETLDFPDHLPSVLDLVGGPKGDVWVLRTPTAAGQTWDVVDATGEVSGRVEFPAGWRLAAVLAESIVVIVTDELGVETVQVHRLRVG